jgi:phosphate/phosphite/phosphonate ABC transporter binding protein
MHGFKRFAVFGLLAIGTPLVMISCPAVAAGPDGLAEEGVLKVGIIPAEDARAVVRQSKDVMEQINKALNMKTEIFVGSDYNATIEAMRGSKVDVALLGAFGYVLATTQAPVEAFAVTVTKASNSPDYHSIIIARKDEGDLTSLRLAQGPHLCFRRSELDLRLIDAESGDDGQSHRSGERSEESDLFRRP